MVRREGRKEEGGKRSQEDKVRRREKEEEEMKMKMGNFEGRRKKRNGVAQKISKEKEGVRKMREERI